VASGFQVLAEIVVVADVQKACFFLGDIDKRGLEALDDPASFPLVDVSHDVAVALPLDVKFADDPIFDKGDARL
jgi:hypothetical protein